MGFFDDFKNQMEKRDREREEKILGIPEKKNISRDIKTKLVL